MSTKLLVGFGRADMTPPPGIPLGGQGNDAMRPSKNVLDPLYATCVAFTDADGSTVLMYTMDILYSPGWVLPALAEALGLSVERIHISGTHSHAAPVRMVQGPWPGNRDLPEAEDYLLHILQPAAIRAGKEALADRKPAEMFFASTHTHGMNFVRRYFMSDDTWSGASSVPADRKPVFHESAADAQMQLVRFVREGGRDVVLCNYQVHQTNTGGTYRYDVSADNCGVMRRIMEEETGCCFAYFTGACGNVVTGSRLAGEARFSAAEYQQYGRALADYAQAAAKHYRPARGGRVAVRSVRLELPVDHHLDGLADQMLPIVQIWEETGDIKRCNELALGIGLHSIYNVQSALGKMRLPAKKDITLAAFSVGELAFAVVPYEMFDTNGMEVKDASPFGMTFVATCADDTRSYIPSALAFEHGGYEIDRCLFLPGTGEVLAEEYGKMLDDMHTAAEKDR